MCGLFAMTSVTEPTIRFDIFIAGDLAQAKQTCREFCLIHGECVTVEPVTFIYTGGEECGVRVGLINYPRFPRDAATLNDVARRLAQMLLHRLFQHSYSIVGSAETVWFSLKDTP